MGNRSGQLARRRTAFGHRLKVRFEPFVLRVEQGFEFSASLIDVAVYGDFCQFNLPQPAD
jgi:hypothetical protein